jgi:tRNA-specific 2-thiouridylase
MFKEYQQGRTPNPDILCNREIKFDLFLKAAMKLNADYVATGHYCRKDMVESNGNSTYRLLAGKDPNKDQSYFLCQLTQAQLAKSLFPIGELLKPEVRKIAKEQDLVTAEKKDSQGLCFIGKVRLPDFLQQQLKPKKGRVIEIEANSPMFTREELPETESAQEKLKVLTQPFVYNPKAGKVIGEHKGAHYYTIGQRKGLGIGGTPLPLFIIDTDTQQNIIYTGQGENHPGLLRKGLFVKKENIHWVRPDIALKPGENRNYDARIRYRQPLDKATLFMEEEGLYVIFEVDQKAIAAGQFVAWYDNEELIGSGVIN